MLHFLVEGGEESVKNVSKALALGANPNQVAADPLSSPVLLHAVTLPILFNENNMKFQVNSAARIKMIGLLLSHKCNPPVNVNSVDNQGQTVIHKILSNSISSSDEKTITTTTPDANVTTHDPVHALSAGK